MGHPQIAELRLYIVIVDLNPKAAGIYNTLFDSRHGDARGGFCSATATTGTGGRHRHRQQVVDHGLDSALGAQPRRRLHGDHRGRVRAAAGAGAPQERLLPRDLVLLLCRGRRGHHVRRLHGNHHPPPPPRHYWEGTHVRSPRSASQRRRRSVQHHHDRAGGARPCRRLHGDHRGRVRAAAGASAPQERLLPRDLVLLLCRCRRGHVRRLHGRHHPPPPPSRHLERTHARSSRPAGLRRRRHVQHQDRDGDAQPRRRLHGHEPAVRWPAAPPAAAGPGRERVLLPPRDFGRFLCWGGRGHGGREGGWPLGQVAK